MDEEQRERYRAEAERGDLRPQFNPHSPAALAALGPLPDLRPILLDRFWQLRRPIADASHGAGPEARLSDIGNFLYLVETLRRQNYAKVEEMLAVLLDEFSPFEERSYDELFLWCIVQLGRTDPVYARRYWPEVLLLDATFRNEDWQHDAPQRHLVEQPYRLTDLVLYYHAVHTVQDRHRQGRRPGVTLGVLLRDLFPGLTSSQRAIAHRAVQNLKRPELPPRYRQDGQPINNDRGFGDACGLLAEWERRQRAAEPPAVNDEGRA